MGNLETSEGAGAVESSVKRKVGTEERKERVRHGDKT